MHSAWGRLPGEKPPQVLPAEALKINRRRPRTGEETAQVSIILDAIAAVD
jgi:hypothetical protein